MSTPHTGIENSASNTSESSVKAETAKAKFPAPRLCLRVGVTANRWRLPNEGEGIRIDPANRESLEGTIRHVLTQISHAVDDVHATGIRNDFYDAAPSCIRLISPLAEGGDRIVAGVATTLAKPWELYVITPEDISAQPDRDRHIPLKPLWDKAQGRLMIGGAQLDDDSLVEVNRRLLWNCDLLVAVWDTKGARGEAGTGNVIQLARELGLPVVNIDAFPATTRVSQHLPPHAFRVLEPDGKRSVENSDDAVRTVVARLLAAPAEFAEEELEDLESAEVVPASLERHTDHSRKQRKGSARSLLDTFRAEKVNGALVRKVSGLAWGAVMRALTIGAKNPVHLPSSRIKADVNQGYPPPWEKAMAPVPGAGDKLEAILSPSFRRADYFASAYAMRHRGSTVWLVVLAPFAVLFAWLALPTLPEVHAANARAESTPFNTTMVVFELIVLSSIIMVYVRALSMKFHERWLDYRLLAERMRHLGFLWFMARGSLVQRVPLQDTPEDPHTAWVNWWYRATARCVPIPSVQFTPAYLQWYKEFLRDHVVEDQKKYLSGTFHAAEVAEHRLHRIAWIPFGLAFVAAATHAAEVLWHFELWPSLERTIPIAALVLPGFGAALHAFASNLGLPEQALRSRSTIRALSVVLEGLNDVKIDNPKGEQSANANAPNLAAGIALGDLAQQTASALGDDLVGWRVDYLVRPTPQPG